MGLPKKGDWTVCRFKSRLSKKERMVFLRGVPRCVTRGGEVEGEKDLPCPFSKVGKKCPNFLGKNADCDNIGQISHVKC